MPLLNPNFVIAGAALNLYGAMSYMVDTVKGETQPNRVTWFLWAVAPLIAFSAEIGAGVGIISLMTFMVGFGPLLIFISSFVNSKSYWAIGRFDVACGVCSLLALVLWAITRTSNVAIIFSIAADALAATPTLFKAYQHPKSESSLAFFAASISSVITLLTATSLTVAKVAFPVYIFVMSATLAYLIRVRPMFRDARTRAS